MTKPESTNPALTRRGFMGATAGALSAGALASTGFAAIPARKPRRRRKKDNIHVGLVGCGGRGTGAAAQALAGDSATVLYAMGDAFGDRLEAARGRLVEHSDAARIDVPESRRFTGFESYQQVIDSDVDVVLLATPPVFRPAQLEYAVAHNKHVFCEKPVAVDAPGIRRVLALDDEVRKRNLSVMSGFCWRYSFPQRETYKRLQEGAIGEIRALETTYLTSPLSDKPREPGWSDMEWQLRNWQAFTWLSGDHIVEQAIHGIDWISWALGDELPVAAYGNGGRQCREGEWTGNMFDHFSIVYEFAGGQRATHLCRQISNCANDNSAYFIGSEGFCRSNPWGPECVIENNGMEMWRYEGDNNDMYQTEHNELFAGIRAGDHINACVPMANSTMMGIMGRMCAYTGRKLTWDECLNSEENLTPDSWDWTDREFPEVAKPGRTPFV